MTGTSAKEGFEAFVRQGADCQNYSDDGGGGNLRGWWREGLTGAKPVVLRPLEARHLSTPLVLAFPSRQHFSPSQTTSSRLVCEDYGHIDSKSGHLLYDSLGQPVSSIEIGLLVRHLEHRFISQNSISSLEASSRPSKCRLVPRSVVSSLEMSSRLSKRYFDSFPLQATP